MLRPKASDQWDVVVLGGGISGLLIASELSRTHRTVVIEKRLSLLSSKYWLTDEESANSNADLRSALDCSYTQLDFISSDWGRYSCYGKYLLWDTEKLTKLLLRKIESNGGIVMTGKSFHSYALTPVGIDVFFHDTAVSARLIIDCMGGMSPIVHSARLMDVHGYYTLFGGTFRAKETIAPVALHNLTLARQPVYVEAFPTSRQDIHIALIVPERSIKPTKELGGYLKYLIQQTPYSNVIGEPAGQDCHLSGIVPVGRMSKTALDRIVFFGEAGQHNPAASATMLTRVLYRYKDLSRFISSCLDADTLSEKALRDTSICFLDSLNQSIQEALFANILNWSSTDYKNIIDDVRRYGDDRFFYDLMFGNLQESKSSLARRLLRMKKEGCHDLFSNILRGALFHGFRKLASPLFK